MSRMFLFVSVAVIASAIVVSACEPSGRDDTSEVGSEQALTGGTLDVSFGDGGRASLAVPGIGTTAYSLELASGKLLVVAPVAGKSPPLKSVIARLTEKGDLDPSFGNGGTVEVGDLFTRAAEVANGDIVLYRDYDATRFGRLQADGTADLAFGPNGLRDTKISGAQRTVVIQASDGSFYAWVGLDLYGKSWRLYRFASDGVLDGSFHQKGYTLSSELGIFYTGIEGVTESGGFVYLANGFTGSQSSYGLELRRIDASTGAFDAAWGAQGVVRLQGTYASPAALETSLGPLPNGGVAVLLNSSYTALNSAGSIEHSMWKDGVLPITNRRFVQVEPNSDRCIVASGSRASWRIERWLSSGAPDPAFAPIETKNFLSTALGKSSLYLTSYYYTGSPQPGLTIGLSIVKYKR